MPSKWLDDGGAVGSTVYREVPKHDSDYYSPRMRALEKHRPYIDIEEWESRTCGLKEEKLPVKRRELRNYYVGGVSPWVDDVSNQHHLASPLQPAQPVQPMEAFIPLEHLPRAADVSLGGSLAYSADTPAKVMSSNTEALRDRPVLAAEVPSAAAAPSPPKQSLAKAVAEAKALKAARDAAKPPTQLGTPRRVVRKPWAQGDSSSPGQARVDGYAVGAADRAVSALLEAQEGPTQDATDPQIRVVPKQLSSQARTKATALPRRVTSRDAADALPGQQLRPLREQNIANRKRLDALLESKISQTHKHAARAFEAIPSQNLRVQ